MNINVQFRLEAFFVRFYRQNSEKKSHIIGDLLLYMITINLEISYDTHNRGIVNKGDRIGNEGQVNGPREKKSLKKNHL